MHDEDNEKSKKVDDFNKEMKRMEALVNESKRHAKEEEKKRKVSEWNVQACDSKSGSSKLAENSSGEKNEQRGRKADKKAGHDSRFAKGRSKRLG